MLTRLLVDLNHDRPTIYGGTWAESFRKSEFWISRDIAIKEIVAYSRKQEALRRLTLILFKSLYLSSKFQICIRPMAKLWPFLAGWGEGNDKNSSHLTIQSLPECWYPDPSRTFTYSWSKHPVSACTYNGFHVQSPRRDQTLESILNHPYSACLRRSNLHFFQTAEGFSILDT
jgi:hypothetical protein